MKRRGNTTAEEPRERAEQDRPPDARQVPDSLKRERLEAEMADCKPGASGFGLRTKRSKC